MPGRSLLIGSRSDPQPTGGWRDGAPCAITAALGDRLGNVVAPTSVWTGGHVSISANASSIVPDEVQFFMQWRDGDAGRLARMELVIRAAIAEVAGARGVSVSFGRIMCLGPVQMDKTLRAALEDAVAETVWRSMPSGALPDATNVARQLPVAMLFVPSIGGISKAFEENMAEDDLVCGLNVLTRATARLCMS